MPKIFKYPLDLNKDVFQTGIHKPVKFLTVQMQGPFPTVWAIVDDGAPEEQWVFRCFGTGELISNAEDMTYLGTVQVAGYVWHYFAEKV